MIKFYLFLFLVSSNLFASPLTDVDKSLNELFKNTEIINSKNNIDTLDFNEICHQKLETHLAKFDGKNQIRITDCLKDISPDISIDLFTKILNQDRITRFTAREQIPLYASFLKRCHDNLSNFHLKIQEFAKAAYDISFQDKNKPKSISTPKGYKPTKYYGNIPDACYNTGFKAAMFTPGGNEDHVIFAITGTEAQKKYSDGSKRETFNVKRKSGFFGGGKLKMKKLSAKDIDKEDWSTSNGGATGSIQAASTCAEQLVQDAVKIAKEKGKKIIFTGHSLGGALSQGLSYRVKKELEIKKIAGDVHSINFMPAPGYHTVPEADRDETILNKVLAVNYVSPGDIVSTQQANFIANSGPHLGEVRYMKRKEEIERAYIDENKSLDPHHLDHKCFGPLGCSEHINGQEIFQRNNKYIAGLHKKREAKKNN